MLERIAKEVLFKNFLLNVDMLECIRRNSAEILFASPDAVLLIDIPSQTYMMSIINLQVVENLISKIPASAKMIVTHDKASYELLLKKFKFKDTLICTNSVYTKNSPLKQEGNMIDIKLLTLEFKNTILEYYSKAEITDIDYIEDRLKAKVMLGAFMNNDLCGFIGSHAEGSIGMLEVLPKYRGNGIGAALQIAATNDALANNRYPYGQVVEGNLVSTALQKKLGYELSEEKVYWLIK